MGKLELHLQRKAFFFVYTVHSYKLYISKMFYLFLFSPKVFHSIWQGRKTAVNSSDFQDQDIFPTELWELVDISCQDLPTCNYAIWIFKTPFTELYWDLDFLSGVDIFWFWGHFETFYDSFGNRYTFLHSAPLYPFYKGSWKPRLLWEEWMRDYALRTKQTLYVTTSIFLEFTYFVTNKLWQRNVLTWIY